MSKLIIRLAFAMALIAGYGVVNAAFTDAAPKKNDSPGCADGVCPLPAAGAATISVVSPIPESAVPPMAAAPRLKSLSGKTIALVGGSFMANVTHPELKRLILAEFPKAKVYLLSEIGSAGPWPRPGVVRRGSMRSSRATADAASARRRKQARASPPRPWAFRP